MNSVAASMSMWCQRRAMSARARIVGQKGGWNSRIDFRSADQRLHTRGVERQGTLEKALGRVIASSNRDGGEVIDLPVSRRN